jgi:hypothetical protein
VTPAKTSMTLTAKPTKAKAGQGNDFTATLKAGAGGSLLSGNVVFSVSDSPATPPAKRKCVGGDSVAITVKKGVGTAKCVLDAGWYGATSTSYDVTASFGGNSNFTAVTKSKAGT